jgi:MarR family transcriptional regulator, organic hydroperoxide resistance regulator
MISTLKVLRADWSRGGQKRMTMDSHFLDWIEQSRQREGEPDDLERDVAEVAQLVMMLGWLERRHFAQELSPRGLTIPQFFTMVTIHRCEAGCTMGMLAGETHQCSATMTGIIDRLLRMKLVERTRDEHDRRLVMVTLTKAGREILREALDRRLERLRAVLQHFDRQHRSHAVQAFKMYVALTEKELGEEETRASASC